MNCRRTIKDFSVPDDAQRDVDRVNTIFTDCRQRYANTGNFLFGDYSIADAMFTPVVMRFNTYGVTLDGVAAEYLQTISNQPSVLEWIEIGSKEKEVIESDEL